MLPAAAVEIMALLAVNTIGTGFGVDKTEALLMKPGSIMVPVLDPVTSLLTSPLFNATVVAAIEIVKTV